MVAGLPALLAARKQSKHIHIPCVFFIFLFWFSHLVGIHSQVNVAVKHDFSVEIDPDKRNFIIQAHTPAGSKPDFHVFGDVKVFHDGSGHCFTCNCTHAAPRSVDVLFAGPSCKKLSKQFTDRGSFGDCYTSGKGCSGHTYVYGVLEASRQTCPAILFFENVLGVAESATVGGVKVAAPIKASWLYI